MDAQKLYCHGSTTIAPLEIQVVNSHTRCECHDCVQARLRLHEAQRVPTMGMRFVPQPMPNTVTYNSQGISDAR